MVKIAKKKKKSTKLTRAEMKGPDQFQEASTKGAEWLSENRVQVAAACAAIFVLALGIYLFRVMSHGEAHAVTAELTKTLKIVEGKVESKKKNDNNNNNTDDDEVKTFKTSKDKYQAATKKISEQLKDHSGAKASAFLRLYLANSQYRLGKHKEAIESYQKFLKGLNAKDPIYIMGLSGLLRASEAAKQDKVGVDALTKFLTTGAKAFRPTAAMRLAEYYERKKDYKNAKKLYKQLSDTKSLKELSGEKKLSVTMTQLQTKAKQRLALLPTK